LIHQSLSRLIAPSAPIPTPQLTFITIPVYPTQLAMITVAITWNQSFSMPTLSKFIAILGIPTSSPLYLYVALLFGG
jgi:hypothetical protein